MGRKKLFRRAGYFDSSFAVLGSDPTVATRWPSIFQNNHPLVLELGCGKGDFAIAYAAAHPQRNVVGIDTRPARLWYGVTEAKARGLTNVRFMHEDVCLVANRFLPASVTELWITFPDPYPKKHHISRRLTSPHFLQLYKKILATNGVVHFKTDNNELFDYTVGVVQSLMCTIHDLTRDLHAGCSNPDALFITGFERKFLAQGLKINYMNFSLYEL